MRRNEETRLRGCGYGVLRVLEALPVCFRVCVRLAEAAVNVEDEAACCFGCPVLTQAAQVCFRYCFLAAVGRGEGERLVAVPVDWHCCDEGGCLLVVFGGVGLREGGGSGKSAGFFAADQDVAFSAHRFYIKNRVIFRVDN